MRKIIFSSLICVLGVVSTPSYAQSNFLNTLQGMVKGVDQPYLSGPVLMRDTGRLDRPVVATGA